MVLCKILKKVTQTKKHHLELAKNYVEIIYIPHLMHQQLEPKHYKNKLIVGTKVKKQKKKKSNRRLRDLE